MSEGTFRSYDPLKYHVNNVADLDADVVKAHMNKDVEAIDRMTRNGDQDFHIFICINKDWHRYNVLLNDCVEFAKEFCVAMLSYCNNHRELERDINSKIRHATASGLSVEHLSRRVRSSGMVGNTFLEGFEISTFLGGRYSVLLVIAFFVYPVIVSAITAIIVISFVNKQ